MPVIIIVRQGHFHFYHKPAAFLIVHFHLMCDRYVMIIIIILFARFDGSILTEVALKKRSPQAIRMLLGSDLSLQKRKFAEQ